MPGQPYRGKLSDFQTTKMLTVASRPPAENARRIIGDGRQVLGLKSRNPALVSALSWWICDARVTDRDARLPLD